MSWNIYTPEAVSHEDAAKLTPDLTGHNFLPGAESATQDQIKAAQKAVAALVKAVGGKGGQVSVSMSGHANANHEPEPGWANETITVTVSVAQNTLPTPQPDDTQ